MSLIVRESRAWIGTPYLHQASLCGVGTDCLGLVRGVWRAVLGAEPELLPSYTPDWGELGANEALADAMGRHFVSASGPEQPGDVLLFRMRPGAVAKHLGILAEIGGGASFIHAYDRHGVVESPLGPPWRRRIAGRFRFPL